MQSPPRPGTSRISDATRATDRSISQTDPTDGTGWDGGPPVNDEIKFASVYAAESATVVPLAPASIKWKKRTHSSWSQMAHHRLLAVEDALQLPGRMRLIRRKPPSFCSPPSDALLPSPPTTINLRRASTEIARAHRNGTAG